MNLWDCGLTERRPYGRRSTNIGGQWTPERWREFYRGMVAVGVYASGIDVDRAYVTDFVNHRAGIEMKK